jgi:phenylpyruvate tautomerase PptA (4-oxalocrotonate tautomerase family)
MPYISVITAQRLSSTQKETIKSELGRLITIIPAKTEATLLIDFSEGHSMYKAGAEVPAAFIDVRLWTKAELEPKKQFTKETFELLTRELGLKPEHIYLTITEFENWGSGGVFK